MLNLMIVVPATVLVFWCSFVNVQYVNGESGGLFREYKEDLNEYLTSEEVDRLVYGNDESVISEKIKNLPDMGMNPPGINQHHLSVPTMDPPLDSVAHGPVVKKLPPQRNNFMNIMKTAARMLARNNNRDRAPRQRTPVPQYRSRPSTLTSSQPDQLEVAFKRIEIMASRAGLNMSSMPRRNQMQVIRKLSAKLPPRMSQLMKATLDNNSQKLYDYLPEPSRDPLVEDNPDFLHHFMEGAKVTMDGANYNIMGDDHHTFEYSEPTHTSSTGGDIIISSHEPGELITTHITSDPDHHHTGEVMITDHQPGTDYSIPNYESQSSSSGISAPSATTFGFSAPPPTYENDHHSSSFGSSGSSSSGQISDSNHNNDHNLFGASSSSSSSSDLKPVAAPLIGETHEVYSQAGSENLPTIISPNSPSRNPSPPRSNKALKVTNIKNASPSSSPVIRVSMPTKDEIKISKPIRVSIITKDNVTNINPYVSQPVFTQDETIAEVKEIEKTKNSGEIASSKEQVQTTTSASNAHVLKAETTATVKTVTTPTTTENSITLSPLLALHSDEHVPLPHKFIPMPVSQEEAEKAAEKETSKPVSPAAGLLLKEVDDDYGIDGLGLGDFGLNDEDDQDLTSSELIAELKKYNSDYANSLEIDYPLAPHPLEYPDHPDHPDNSDSVPSTAAATTIASPKPTMPQQNKHNQHPHRPHVRPHIQPHGGPRLPIRPRIRPPPGHFGRPGPNGRPLPRRPPHGHPRPGFRPPLRINEVTVSQIPQTTQKECDFFSEDLCLAVQDYPIEAISEAMSTKEASKLLVKEPAESSWVDGVGKNQEGGYNFKHYYGEGNNKVNAGASGSGAGAGAGEAASHRHRDFAGEGGFLCPSKVAYGRVKKGKSYTTGEWKYIVNYGEFSQTLRLEKCLSPGNSCSYVMPHYRTSCSQVYNYNRLLAWDSEKGLHMDVFKVPTCCTCHVQGYYIPGQQQGMTPARRRDIPPKLQYASAPLQQQQRLRQAQQKQQQQQQVHLRREQLSQQQAQLSKQAQSKLNDELQDLLAQYSSLRERIAKKKNERQHISYSVSYSNSTKESINAKRESTKSIMINSAENAAKKQQKQKVPMQRIQRAMMVNLIKRMKKGNTTITKKKLTQLLKAANLTAKPKVNPNPHKASHFNGTAHKMKTSRALTLHKLANLITALSNRSGRHGGHHNGTKVNGTENISHARMAAFQRSARRLLGQRSLQLQAGGSQSQQAQQRSLKQTQQQLLHLLQSRQGRFSSHETKLDKLKLLLSRNILKNRRMGHSGKPGPLNNKRLQLLHQLQMQKRRQKNNNSSNSSSNPLQSRTKQRLRLGGAKKTSKVNYSYHPIMDYFGGAKPS